MYTLGYSFRPWRDAKSIAEGPRSSSYVRQTASDDGIEEKIRFGHRVVRAEWSTEDARWTVEATRGDTRRDRAPDAAASCSCAAATTATTRATRPTSRGSSASPGRIVHPQHWTDDVDYAGKRVVVIGSGATAVTLVPAMARARGTSRCCSARPATSCPYRRKTRSPSCCAASCPRSSPIRSCAGRTCCSRCELPAQPAPAHVDEAR